MPRVLKNIPLLDLVSFLIETPQTPMHVGVLQVFEPVNGTREQIVRRVLRGFRDSEIAAPFNCVPLFPPLAAPKWALADEIDIDYHVRHVAVAAPGGQKELIDLVMDLHAGLLDRSRPCWIAYVIDALEQQRFAVYIKMHHACIDGVSANMRFERIAAHTPQQLQVTPLWAPLFEENASNDEEPLDLLHGMATAMRSTRNAASGLFSMLGQQLRQVTGQLPSETPLPFSAPQSLFNAPVHATRRLGIGTQPLLRFTATARLAAVSVNDVALTLVGAALERYAAMRHEEPARALVAVCPMSIRAAGDTSASTQIAAISIKLGEPGSAIRERLQQVRASSRDAKAQAREVSREGLVTYLALLGGTVEMLSKSPLAQWVPPSTNVNVSNVAGPAHPCYLAGAEMLGSYPVSTLAGGTAINITFASSAGRMDFSVISDAIAIPDPQSIIEYIEQALTELEAALQPRPRRKATARRPKR